jgi:multicomponent Na+:H+ antiporter subunit F
VIAAVIVAAVIVGAILIAAAAVLALIRMERGPSMLDRTVAFDLLTTTIVGAVAVEAIWSRRAESIPVILVLSLVGFIGSVAIARFATREAPPPPTPSPGSSPALRTAADDDSPNTPGGMA